MALPLAALIPAVGSALGGLGAALTGGKKVRVTTLTGTNSLQNSFAPTNAVTLGGGFQAAPYAPITGNPASQAVPTLTPDGEKGYIPSLPGVSSNGGLLSGPLPLVAAAAIGFIILTKDK